MSNTYIYNTYQQYSPLLGNSGLSTSPTFQNMHYLGGSNSSASSSLSSSSNSSSLSSNYSLHNSRLRYYLSKSFDAEDDMEFCPDIPETLAFSGNSPQFKKFNPYTATVFSPTSHSNIDGPSSPANAVSQSPRFQPNRIRKPIEIVNPQTKVRITSPAAGK